jgi:hypothetical protein
VTVPPYALPLGLIAAITATVGVILWYAVAHWPLPKIMTGRMAAVFATGFAGVLVLVWRMGATGDWTPPDATTTILGALLIPLSAILFAGGEDAPDAVAARAARAERVQGVFPTRPEAEVAPPPRVGWPLVLGAVLLAVVVAGCTWAALQAAGWLRP